jgi:hypothetical protein
MTPKDKAIAAILAERERQVSVEGWTPEHDDRHDKRELLQAALIYYVSGAVKDAPLAMRIDGAPIAWPWDASWWKSGPPQRDLVRAGALCRAEMDRLKRKYGPYAPVDYEQDWLELIVAALAALEA